MDMKPSRFTEEQIIGILREQEVGMKPVQYGRLLPNCTWMHDNKRNDKPKN
jgi:hypothetical protein